MPRSLASPQRPSISLILESTTLMFLFLSTVEVEVDAPGRAHLTSMVFTTFVDQSVLRSISCCMVYYHSHLDVFSRRKLEWVSGTTERHSWFECPIPVSSHDWTTCQSSTHGKSFWCDRSDQKPTVANSLIQFLEDMAITSSHQPQASMPTKAPVNQPRNPHDLDSVRSV
jgi:hypothetical protein